MSEPRRTSGETKWVTDEPGKRQAGVEQQLAHASIGRAGGLDRARSGARQPAFECARVTLALMQHPLQSL
jgi:hypothetical protein